MSVTANASQICRKMSLANPSEQSTNKLDYPANMRKSSNSLLSVTLSSNSPIDSTLPGWNPLSTEYNSSSYIPHGLRRHGGRFWASCEKAPERNIVTPPPGKRADFPAATIKPSTLVAEREPVQVLLSIRGDVGNYVQGVRSQPSPQGIGLPPVIDGSVSVAGGDSIKKGWSVDFYGSSDIRVRYGHGVGWKDQEDEFMTEGWPRKYVCCVCSLKWKATPIPGTLFLEQDRKALQIPVPLDTQKDPGFTRPQASETHLTSSSIQSHRTFLDHLYDQIIRRETLSAAEREISYRLMVLFNDLDARMQRSISEPASTVLLPDHISSPAVPREHIGWISYLGLRASETYRAYFFDDISGQHYFREYDMSDDGTIAGPRIVSHNTGRPVKTSRFLLP
ncbi:hypothetical protein CNYM01_08419 [Colletotrichum nymphaeae SA-01]|uniref:NEAT domain-containing protein n=1 Tax=Colletotrichum nymphaeae SA-01 TaxID=1460502 RepID=A0A135UTB8_9PEZI|nr:hypothetical protein CNYM01_08419 [Colletotrichum nymphaeae SA-01]